MEQEQVTEIETKMTEARFQFAIKCMHIIMQIMPKNVIAFSPHIIYEGLLMVYFMSSGAIEERLKLILFLKDVSKYDLIKYYSSRRDFEQSENNASAAFSDYDAERTCWIEDTNFNRLRALKNIFNNYLEIFDFDNTPTARIERINKAIENATKNYICFPVRLGEVRDNMELALMTVSRLKAQQFQRTQLSLVDIRNRKKFFSHELNMHVCEFPYRNENRSLFMFSPAISRRPADFSGRRFTANGVFDLIERLSTEEGMCTLRNLLDSYTSLPADKTLVIEPLFDLEVDVPMLPLFEAFGIEELLKPDAINLDSFFVKDGSVHLGNAMHRIRIKVTETHTSAGAVNLIYSGNEIPNLGKRRCDAYDYPFVWLIYDNTRRNVLFAGAFNNFDYLDPSHPRVFH